MTYEQSRLHRYVGDDPEVTPVPPWLGGADSGGVGDRVRGVAVVRAGDSAAAVRRQRDRSRRERVKLK